MRSHLIIRADASSQIGMGHLMRCLALAQAWQNQGDKVTFVTNCSSRILRERVRNDGPQIINLDHSYPHHGDWEQTSRILETWPGAWVVLDGYHFDANYQRRIKNAGHPLLVIDDTAHHDCYIADVVLNQNIKAEQLRYSCKPYTCLLLGAQYVLLRSDFLAWRKWQREIPAIARKVLVSLGGADPDNQTLKVIRALHGLASDELECVVIVGATNPHVTELQSIMRNLQSSVQLVQNIANMPELMAWADIVISGGGITAWEAAFMSLPSIILVLAENQHENAVQLEATGLAINLGELNDISLSSISSAVEFLLGQSEMREMMSARGRKIIDGLGAERVIEKMRGNGLFLRGAVEEDCRMIWKWANNPLTRKGSFSTGPIAWKDHQQWFFKRLRDPSCLFFIATDRDNISHGQIRYKIQGKEAIVSVNIRPRSRRMGWGSRIIRYASEKLLKEGTAVKIHAYIKPENKASIRSFIKAGFFREETETDIKKGRLHYVFSKN